MVMWLHFGLLGNWSTVTAIAASHGDVTSIYVFDFLAETDAYFWFLGGKSLLRTMSSLNDYDVCFMTAVFALQPQYLLNNHQPSKKWHKIGLIAYELNNWYVYNHTFGLNYGCKSRITCTVWWLNSSLIEIPKSYTRAALHILAYSKPPRRFSWVTVATWLMLRRYSCRGNSTAVKRLLLVRSIWYNQGH